MKLALIGNHLDTLLFLYYEYKDWSSNRVELEDDRYYNEHMGAWFQEEMEYFSEVN
ncbi:hypothetical protein V7S43_009164 [Phytophthora oleae]|uniref:Uncharacterized protein n=1 Tax=Phytophthora oleae TaxID=2107226 RepID=A0ABD3FHH2_9STRA